MKRMKDMLAFDRVEGILSQKVLERDVSEIIVYSLIVVYTLIFSYYTILKHNAFSSYAWDLGIYNQAVWTTLYNDRLFYTTCELFINPSGSFFGIHFKPILFLILPIYALYPTPETLLILQAFVIALAALPLYWLARNELNRKSAALAFVIMYLLYPPIHGVNWFDFHTEVFLPIIFFFSLYSLAKGKWWKYLASIIMAVMTTESASLIVTFIGFYEAVVYREKIFKAVRKKNLSDKTILIPLITIMVAVAWYLFALRVISAVNPNPPPEIKATSWYSVLGLEGDPLWNIPKTIVYMLQNPLKVLDALTYDLPAKSVYLIFLFGPLTFTSLLNPASLLPVIPLLGAYLLSNYPPLYQTSNHIHAFIIPFFFVAAVYGVKKLTRLNKLTLTRYRFPSLGSHNHILAFMLVTSALFSIFASPLIRHSPRITEHEVIVEQIIQLVPSNSSILTTNSLFPHFSSRVNAYCHPINPLQWAAKHDEFVRYVWNFNADYVLIDLKSDQAANALESAVDMISIELRNNDIYGLLASADGVLLFKRGYKGNPTMFIPYTATYDYERLSVSDGEIINDNESTSSKILHHATTGKSRNTFWLGPHEPLPSGTYLLTLRLKLGSLVNKEILTVNITDHGGGEVFMREKIYGSDFEQAKTWQNFTLNFILNIPVLDTEFIGLNASNATDVYLDYIEVRQVSSSH